MFPKHGRLCLGEVSAFFIAAGAPSIIQNSGSHQRHPQICFRQRSHVGQAKRVSQFVDRAFQSEPSKSRDAEIITGVNLAWGGRIIDKRVAAGPDVADAQKLIEAQRRFTQIDPVPPNVLVAADVVFGFCLVPHLGFERVALVILAAGARAAAGNE